MANSVDSGKMSPFVAFYLALHCFCPGMSVLVLLVVHVHCTRHQSRFSSEYADAQADQSMLVAFCKVIFYLERHKCMIFVFLFGEA